MDRTLEQENWMMLLFLSLHTMGNTFAVGLEAVAQSKQDAEELGTLYRELREEILGMARTDIVAARMAREDREKIKV